MTIEQKISDRYELEKIEKMMDEYYQLFKNYSKTYDGHPVSNINKKNIINIFKNLMTYYSEVSELKKFNYNFMGESSINDKSNN
jgi:hypothetical protein